MYIKNKRGQSTVEYILLVTAVVAVLILFITNKSSGGFTSTLNGTFNQAADDIQSESGALAGSHNPSPANSVAPTPPVLINVNY